MPSLEELNTFVTGNFFLKVLSKSRPENIQIRTIEGTKAMLEKMVAEGYGSSVSEAGHLALHVGIHAFEAHDYQVEEQSAPKGDMGPVFPPGSKGDVGVGPEDPE